MRLEDYFDFADYEQFGEIRLAGHRIYLHDVLFEYLKNGRDTPALLLERFESLDMPKVLACLLYYHTHRPAMDAMLENYLEYCRTSKEKWERENADRLNDLRERIRIYAASKRAVV